MTLLAKVLYAAHPRPRVAATVRSTLSRRGPVAQSAANGHEAVGQVRRLKPDVVLIVRTETGGSV